MTNSNTENISISPLLNNNRYTEITQTHPIIQTQNTQSENRLTENQIIEKPLNKRKTSIYEKYKLFFKRTLILESFHLNDKPVTISFMIIFCIFNTAFTSIYLLLYHLVNDIAIQIKILLITLMYFTCTVCFVLALPIILGKMTTRKINVFFNMSLTTITHFPFIIIWCFLLPEFASIIIVFFHTFVFYYVYAHFLRFSVRMDVYSLIVKVFAFFFPMLIYYHGVWWLFSCCNFKVNERDYELFRILLYFTLNAQQ
ncbi:hypothetical protein CDIK_2523 [Cucumispora dikerogammari]|nr:hypothetical protein CDIK_2523 [Cucumispora dikerogammari]